MYSHHGPHLWVSGNCHQKRVKSNSVLKANHTAVPSPRHDLSLLLKLTRQESLNSPLVSPAWAEFNFHFTNIESKTEARVILWNLFFYFINVDVFNKHRKDCSWHVCRECFQQWVWTSTGYPRFREKSTTVKYLANCCWVCGKMGKQPCSLSYLRTLFVVTQHSKATFNRSQWERGLNPSCGYGTWGLSIFHQPIVTGQPVTMSIFEVRSMLKDICCPTDNEGMIQEG